MKLGDKLRKIRTDKDLNQDNIATELGITTQSYSNIESGKTDVNWSRVLQIAGVFKMSVVEIMIYGEELEEMDFVKSKIELYKGIANAASEDMTHWRKQAMTLSEQMIKMQDEKERLQAELDRIKKPSKSYSTDEGLLLVAAEPGLKKKKLIKQLHKH